MLALIFDVRSLTSVDSWKMYGAGLLLLVELIINLGAKTRRQAHSTVFLLAFAPNKLKIFKLKSDSGDE